MIKEHNTINLAIDSDLRDTFTRVAKNADKTPEQLICNKFDYYRLASGLKRLLSLCKELFRFRKPKLKTLTIEDFLSKNDRFAYGV